MYIATANTTESSLPEVEDSSLTGLRAQQCGKLFLSRLSALSTQMHTSCRSASMLGSGGFSKSESSISGGGSSKTAAGVVSLAPLPARAVRSS